MDQEIASAWADEAEQRDQAMDGGQVSGVPAEQVFSRFVRLCNETGSISFCSKERV